MLSLQSAKDFLKVEHNNDDALIKSLILASDIYIKNACLSNYSHDHLSDLAQKLLVCHWYENREVVGKADKLAFSLEAILSQIKFASKEVQV